MKKTVTALVLAASFLPAYANASDDLDGFRGVKWGSPIEANKAEMKVVEVSGPDAYYDRNKSNMKIGGAELSDLRYGYWQGKFFVAMASTEGYSNFQAIRTALGGQFGIPTQPNQFIDDYQWYGEKSTVYLSCDGLG